MQNYLVSVVSSTLNQQNVSVETIVIVDGGNHNTLEIVKSFKAAHLKLNIGN